MAEFCLRHLRFKQNVCHEMRYRLYRYEARKSEIVGGVRAEYFKNMSGERFNA